MIPSAIMVLLLALPILASAFQFPWYTNYLKGLELYQNQDYRNAMLFFELASMDRPVPGERVVVDLEFLDYSPWLMIAECHYNISQQVRTRNYLLINEIRAAEAYQECFRRNERRSDVRDQAAQRLLDIAEHLEQTTQNYDALQLYSFLDQNTAADYSEIMTLLRAREHFRTGNFRESVTEYRRAEDDGFMKLDDRDPASVRFWDDVYRFAQSLWHESVDHPEYLPTAKALFIQLLKMFPSREGKPLDRQNIHQLLSEIALKEDNTATALDHLEQIKPMNCGCDCFDELLKQAMTTFTLALRNADSRHFPPILAELEKIQDCPSKEGIVSWYKGLLALARHDEPATLAAMEQAQHAGYQSTELPAILACLYANKGSVDRARKELQPLLDNPPPMREQVLALMGEILMAMELAGHGTNGEEAAKLFPSLPLRLVQVLEKNKGKFLITLNNNLTISRSFKAGPYILALDDEFQIDGKVLDFGVTIRETTILKTTVSAIIPFNIISVDAPLKDECMTITTTDSEDGKTWVIAFEIHPDLCPDTIVTGKAIVRMDLPDHPEVTLELRGFVPKKAFVFTPDEVSP